ncbi:crossover junction endonuclease EME1-like isoform X2 [Xenia sp. Carnegie-2017]|uniref:crossover junction endonuclease EME1-like isoform X2 n=1 Tax=Xenia sp. Carnegie-2017 TaxID=2897299 RepID=UPI001F035D7E|nr:crossover junction endonuclease EME1-like isoform X2 [Xenia sp. Carnegie-2017]
MLWMLGIKSSLLPSKRSVSPITISLDYDELNDNKTEDGAIKYTNLKKMPYLGLSTEKDSTDEVLDDSILLKPVFDINTKNSNSSPCQDKSNSSVKTSIDFQVHTNKTNCTNGHVDETEVDSCSSKTYGITVDNCESQDEPGTKRRKRTKEEIEEKKREAILKKATKEKERLVKFQEKQRLKNEKATVVQEKKLQKEKEQMQRKAERLTKNSNQLDGCLKYVTASLDPALLLDEVSSQTAGHKDCRNVILEKLTSWDINYVITSQLFPRSVTWQREIFEHTVKDDDLTIMTSNHTSEENHVIVVLLAEQFVEMIFSSKQDYVDRQVNLDERRKTLLDFVKHVKHVYVGKKITIFVKGMEKYLRNVKLKKQRSFRVMATGEAPVDDGKKKRRRKKVDDVFKVSTTDIEEALIELQIKTNICVYHCENNDDLAMKIAVFTRAVAEKPYKKSLTDSSGFSLDCLDKTSLKVSKDGKGLINVWRQQIEQLNNVSPDMAAAIVSRFPSPQILKQTYDKCQSKDEGMFLLQDILVRRGGGSTATSRRIGPELSKRLYTAFHSKESDCLLK